MSEAWKSPFPSSQTNGKQPGMGLEPHGSSSVGFWGSNPPLFPLGQRDLLDTRCLQGKLRIGRSGMPRAQRRRPKAAQNQQLQPYYTEFRGSGAERGHGWVRPRSSHPELAGGGSFPTPCSLKGDSFPTPNPARNANTNRDPSSLSMRKRSRRYSGHSRLSEYPISRLGASLEGANVLFWAREAALKTLAALQRPRRIPGSGSREGCCGYSMFSLPAPQQERDSSLFSLSCRHARPLFPAGKGSGEEQRAWWWPLASAVSFPPLSPRVQ